MKYYKNASQNGKIEFGYSLIDDNMLVLLPCVGAQGGEAEKIWEYFSKDNVIVNVGRSLMLPNGSESTPKHQFDAAKKYTCMLNELRTKAD